MNEEPETSFSNNQVCLTMRVLVGAQCTGLRHYTFLIYMYMYVGTGKTSAHDHLHSSSTSLFLNMVFEHHTYNYSGNHGMNMYHRYKIIVLMRNMRNNKQIAKTSHETEC